MKTQRKGRRSTWSTQEVRVGIWKMKLQGLRTWAEHRKLKVRVSIRDRPSTTTMRTGGKGQGVSSTLGLWSKFTGWSRGQAPQKKEDLVFQRMA